MKISTKGRYGLRAMLDLALNSLTDHVSLCSIAERQCISESYLEQVFSALRKSGLVKSVKGAQGGYVLADKPDNIRIGTILRVLEGDLSVIDDNNAATQGNNFERCIRMNVYESINTNINSIVDSITLGDLMEEYNKLEGNTGDMYYI
jgi:Rrf2 family protein